MKERKKDERREMAAKLRDEFRIIASGLDKHKTNVNIARVSGGGVGVVGGVIAMVGLGLALAPATMGVSAIVLGAVGGAIATLGGLTAGGAQIFRIVKKKSTKEDVAKMWDEFRQKLKDDYEQEDEHYLLQDCQDPKVQPKEVIESATMSSVAVGKVGVEIGGTVTGRLAVKGAAEAGGQLARTAASVAARALAGTAIALNGILIVVSLYDIIDGSLELSKETGCDGGDLIRVYADYLDEFAQHGEFPIAGGQASVEE